MFRKLYLCLFIDAVSNSNCMSSGGKVMSKIALGKDEEWSDCGLFEMVRSLGTVCCESSRKRQSV